MPFNIANVNAERTISLTIPYEGMGTIVLAYRPGQVNRKQLLAGVKAEADAEDGGRSALDAYFCDLVASWDVQWPDGSPILLQPDEINKIDEVFIQNLVNAIVQDALAGEAKGTRIKRL